MRTSASKCVPVAMVMLALCAAAAAAAERAVPADAFGLHSMVYSNSPYAFKATMFREAAALGVKDIRADLALTQVIRSPGERDWRPVDEYMRLARRYELRVTLVLTATPWWTADCPRRDAPAVESFRCPAAHPGTWAGWTGEIARRTAGVIDHFEIINEPDDPAGYSGSARQYARTLIASYRAIKAANPRAKVLLGGLHEPPSAGWLGQALRTSKAAASFDVANVHVRGSLDCLARQVRRWKHAFARYGFRGPLWVTGHGYPSDAAFQVDPAFRDGPAGQARYLRASLPALVDAGARKVFVTERDNLSGWFASEGVLAGTVSDPPCERPKVIRKPAWFALRALVAGGTR